MTTTIEPVEARSEVCTPDARIGVRATVVVRNADCGDGHVTIAHFTERA
ncbi:hypothetical protein [Streptomyces sp. RKAG293]|nr:hypothetical protein [Streptomyces sp. RKAG293]MCM2422812.1 hypothetical protein [Streptomyces sp. RKAG293]